MFDEAWRKQIVEQAARRSPRAASEHDLANVKARVPRQERLAHRAAEGARQALRPRRRPQGRRRDQRRRRCEIEAADRARAATRSSRASSTRGSPAEAIDVTLPGRRQAHGRAAPDHARAGAGGEALRLDGLRGGRRPRDRGRRATTSPRCACSRTIRRAACRTRSTSRAPTRVLRTHTSPVQIRYMQVAQAAGAHHLPGARVPRGPRRDALADVPPGRGPLGGRGHQPRRPEGHHHAVLPRVLRARRHRRALPPVVLPVRRARRRDRHGVGAQGRRGEVPRDRRRGRRASRRAAQRRHRSARSTRASPSAWASTASRCSSTA